MEIRNKGVIVSKAYAENASANPPTLIQRSIIPDSKGALSVLTSRFAIWENALSYIQNHPATLISGLSVDGSAITVLGRDDHVHNILLQTLLEGGIPGILIYLSILLYFFSHAFRLLKCWHLPLWQQILPLPVLSISLLEMAECLSHFSFGHPPMTIFWFFLGCTVAVSKTIKDSESKKAISDQP